jgi:hypothetical protein
MRSYVSSRSYTRNVQVALISPTPAEWLILESIQNVNAGGAGTSLTHSRTPLRSRRGGLPDQGEIRDGAHVDSCL